LLFRQLSRLFLDHGFPALGMSVRRLIARIEICGLQWWSGGLFGGCCGIFFAALQALAHPFAHESAFNTDASVGSIQDPAGEPTTAADSNLAGGGRSIPGAHKIMNSAKPIPSKIRGQKYISLTTIRKNGMNIATPVWFGEDGDKLYVMTRSDMGKVKRIRNNPQVEVAPCTIRGKVTGEHIAARARILSKEEHAHARQTINRKYWMARLTQLWSRADAYLELTFV
jgi:uncharacterized protein